MDQNLILDMNSRIRILERKQRELKEKVLVINQNMLEEYRTLLSEIKNINQELKSIKDNTLKFQGTFKQIVKEMDSFAGKDQLKALEKYINLWNPFNFVTEEEVIAIINSKSSERKSKKRK